VIIIADGHELPIGAGHRREQTYGTPHAHTMAPAAGMTGKLGYRSCVNKTTSTPPCTTYARSCRIECV